MRGRPRLPTQTKIIRGTFRSYREPDDEPKPTKVMLIPKPAAHLSPEGKRVWKRLARELIEKGILTVLDLPALEILCESYALYREAQKAIFFTPKGKKRTLAQYLRGKNSQTTPELTCMRQSWDTFRSFLTEFGLSPSSRTRLHVAPPKEPEVDPMEGLLKDG